MGARMGSFCDDEKAVDEGIDGDTVEGIDVHDYFPYKYLLERDGSPFFHI